MLQVTNQSQAAHAVQTHPLSALLCALLKASHGSVEASGLVARAYRGSGLGVLEMIFGRLKLDSL